MIFLKEIACMQFNTTYKEYIPMEKEENFHYDNNYLVVQATQHT